MARGKAVRSPKLLAGAIFVAFAAILNLVHGILTGGVSFLICGVALGVSAVLLTIESIRGHGR